MYVDERGGLAHKATLTDILIAQGWDRHSTVLPLFTCAAYTNGSKE